MERGAPLEEAFLLELPAEDAEVRVELRRQRHTGCTGSGPRKTLHSHQRLRGVKCVERICTHMQASEIFNETCGS